MSRVDPDLEPTRPVSDDAKHRDALRTLLDAGTGIVQKLAASAESMPAEKAAPYERLARAIRSTIVLARYIVEQSAKPVAEPLSPTAIEIARRIELRRRAMVEAAIRERARQVQSRRAELHTPADARDDEDLDDGPVPSQRKH